MRLRFRVFGVTICSFDLDLGPALEFVDDECAGEVGDDDAPLIGGGGTHNFERDCNPPNPSGEEPYWEDRGFGFSLQKRQTRLAT